MINLGINFTTENDLAIVRKLAKKGNIKFVEVLIDNFIYFDPQKFQDALCGLPLSFHIMNSHWISEKDFVSNTFIKKIKTWIRKLRPLYVSDHVLIGKLKGSLLPLNIELNYDQSLSVIGKIKTYQEELESIIYLENYPSYFKISSMNQIEFFDLMLAESKCGILFDFSNAFIAQANVHQNWKQWLPIIRKYQANYHIGGYSVVEDTLLFDSHNCDLDAKIVADVKSELAQINDCNLVIERDDYKSTENFLRDISQFEQP